jgi:hypothetical protein
MSNLWTFLSFASLTSGLLEVTSSSVRTGKFQQPTFKPRAPLVTPSLEALDVAKNPSRPLGRCQQCSLWFVPAQPYSVLSFCSEHVECDRSTCSSVQAGDDAGRKHVQSLGAARVGEHPSRAASSNKDMLHPMTLHPRHLLFFLSKVGGRGNRA